MAQDVHVMLSARSRTWHADIVVVGKLLLCCFVALRLVKVIEPRDGLKTRTTIKTSLDPIKSCSCS